MPLTITPSGAANLAATQLIQQSNSFFNQISGALYNGLPQRGGVPAVLATDLQDALGTGNLAALTAALVGFNSTQGS